MAQERLTEECLQPIGLTTCGYPRSHKIHTDKSCISYHEFISDSSSPSVGAEPTCASCGMPDSHMNHDMPYGDMGTHAFDSIPVGASEAGEPNWTSNRECIVSLIFEEMLERDWSLSDIAIRMGGTTEQEIQIDQLALHMYLVVANENIRLGEAAPKLSKAFGLSEEFFVNMENYKPPVAEPSAESEVKKMSYNIPEKRCYNLDDHAEHSWNFKDELHLCPGMPVAKAAESEGSVTTQVNRPTDGKTQVGGGAPATFTMCSADIGKNPIIAAEIRRNRIASWLAEYAASLISERDEARDTLRIMTEAITKENRLRLKLEAERDEARKERDLYALLRGICEDVIDWLGALSYDHGIMSAKNVLDHPLTIEIRKKLQQMYQHPLDDKLLKRTDQLESENAALRAQIEQLCGDVKAIQKDYTDAIRKSRELESEIEELRKERDAK